MSKYELPKLNIKELKTNDNSTSQPFTKVEYNLLLKCGYSEIKLEDITSSITFLR